MDVKVRNTKLRLLTQFRIFLLHPVVSFTGLDVPHDIFLCCRPMVFCGRHPTRFTAVPFCNSTAVGPAVPFWVQFSLKRRLPLRPVHQLLILCILSAFDINFFCHHLIYMHGVADLDCEGQIVFVKASTVSMSLFTMSVSTTPTTARCSSTPSISCMELVE